MSLRFEQAEKYLDPAVLEATVKALAQFDKKISPWVSPSAWLDANNSHIISILQKAGQMIGNYEFIKAYLGPHMIYPRLDYPIEPQFKRRYLKALVKLSELSRRYPECLQLKHITLPEYYVVGGSFGEVYKGRMAGNDIAVKVLKVYQDSDMDAILKNFAREAVIWRQLSHPNVLPFFGVFRLGAMHDRLCLVCPWMKNGNLANYLSSIAPETNCVQMMLDIAQGLAYLHSQGVVHADVKCANILVSDARRACLADFGLSIAKDTLSANLTRSSGATCGTLNWMAPELLPDMHETESSESDTKRPDEACDVHSFGMVCYEASLSRDVFPHIIDRLSFSQMFSGRIPFHNKRDFQVMYAISAGKRPERPFSQLAQTRGLSDHVWDIVVACWRPQPAERLTAEQIIQRLRNLPELPTDDRPLDDYRIPPPSRMLYKTAQHPFAMLEMLTEKATVDGIFNPSELSVRSSPWDRNHQSSRSPSPEAFWGAR
ncbi:hypothetical protein HWV62_24015 [Athelia sp. TMB]|nr:hypothetical protein HWV62_24015 [Athelia sp. TMB]